MAELDEMSVGEQKLEGMSVVALKDLAQRATELAERKKDQGKKDFRTEIVGRIEAAGYTVDDIFPEAGPVKAPSTAKEKAPAKYRNPEDHSQTWSGRGRKPRWLVDAEAAGRDTSDFAIE